MGGGGGGGEGGQCVLLKPKIFIPISTWKVFIGIITPMTQKFIAVKLIDITYCILHLGKDCQDFSKLYILSRK